MSKKPIDPEDYLTKDKIGSGTPNEWLEERLGTLSGKHVYELCLFDIYQQTRKLFIQNKTHDDQKSIVHLYSVKSEIIRYALPRDIEWKKYVDTAHGNLIAKPILDSDFYYRMMAFKLFLLNTREVGRFTDFHFVNSVLKPFPKKNKTERSRAKLLFLQQVDFWVMHHLDTQMCEPRTAISTAVFDWVSDKIGSFTEEELVKFYEYEFSPRRKFGVAGVNESQLKHQYAGCDDETLRAYFNMLKNPATDDGKPFASDVTIEYLLHTWFGVGEPVEFPEGEHVYASIEEMAFFFKAFQDRFQIHKHPTKKKVTQKQIVNFLYQNLSDIFRDNSSETVYRKFTDFADKGYNPNLDWKKNESLKDIIGYK